jgi:hypothetical protein
MRRTTHFLYLAMLIVCLRVAGAQTSTVKSPDRPLTFKELMSGEIVDTPATQLGLSTIGREQVVLGTTAFQLSDGNRLTMTTGDFHSPEEARRYFNYRAEQASVVARSEKKNNKGVVIGYRAEIVAKDAPDKAPSILQAIHEHVYEISSSSLTDSLEFERQYVR